MQTRVLSERKSRASSSLSGACHRAYHAFYARCCPMDTQHYQLHQDNSAGWTVGGAADLWRDTRRLPPPLPALLWHHAASEHSVPGGAETLAPPAEGAQLTQSTPSNLGRDQRSVKRHSLTSLT
jgi:hypothetical protein